VKEALCELNPDVKGEHLVKNVSSLINSDLKFF